MSNASLEQLLNEMIEEFHAAAGDEKKHGSAKRQAYKQKVQLFIVNKKVFEDGIRRIAQLLKLAVLPNARINSIWNNYHAFLLKQEHLIDKNRRKVLKKAKLTLLKSGQVSRDANVYLVNTFEQMKMQKRDKLADFISKEYNELSGRTNTKRDSQFKTMLGGGHKAKIGDEWLGFNVGHGEYGDPTSAIGAARVQQKFKQSGAGLNPTEKKHIENLFVEYGSTLKLDLDHSKILNANGELDINYVLTISLQSTADNKIDAEDERKAAKALLNGLKYQRAVAVHEGSWSLIQGIERILLSAMTRKTKRTKGLKVVIKGAKPADRLQSKSKAGPKSIKTTKGEYIVVNRSINEVSKAVATRTSTKSKSRKRTPSASPLALLALLNKKLPQTVVDNMGAPALENRTGRFASSVRAVNVVQGKHSPTFQYTYQRNPYQRFEGSEPWADGGNRDPRKLIERSIREIAAELAVGRFYTQRV